VNSAIERNRSCLIEDGLYALAALRYLVLCGGYRGLRNCSLTSKRVRNKLTCRIFLQIYVGPVRGVRWPGGQVLSKPERTPGLSQPIADQKPPEIDLPTVKVPSKPSALSLELCLYYEEGAETAIVPH
jgi:hypothetical protein